MFLLLHFRSRINQIVCIFCLILDIFIHGGQANDATKHLELGKEFLARGQLSDALTHYHAAVEADPKNYLTRFKRGTVYLALGKARFAVGDFSKVLELKPDFTAARAQRGAVYLKFGDFDNAESDFAYILRNDQYGDQNEIQYSFDRIEPARRQEKMVNEVLARDDHENAITLLTQLLEISPWSTKLRELRADSFMASNDFLSAVSDLRYANKLTQDSTNGYYKISILLYQLGHATDALKEIRECLKLDPEHKDCFPFYKKLKKVEKSLSDAQNYIEEKDFKSCITSAQKVLTLEKDIAMIQFSANQLLCSCMIKDEQYSSAIGKCREALELHKDPSVLCDRATAYIETEMFEDAIRDYQAALEIDEYLQRAKEGIERARKLQKQSERRDYYKILNVKRTATKQEIVKAYRKAAQKWHPDAYQGDEKKIAEKKFIDVAAAKEVLTDPEKRRQFDMGDDPLDPESNRGGFQGGNPFHHFHQGESPFQFKFHFN